MGGDRTSAWAASDDPFDTTHLEQLDALVDLGLVRRSVSSTQQMDFELPPPIREGLCRRLRARDDASAVMARLVSHAGSVVASTAPALRSSGQMLALERINAEIDTIRLAIDHLAATDPSAATALVLELEPYWVRFAVHEAQEIALSLLKKPDLDETTRARLLYLAAFTSTMVGDIVAGRRQAIEALDLARQTNDRDLLAAAHFELGIVLAQSGQIDDAITSFRAAGELAAELADASRSLRVYGNLGVTLLDAGLAVDATEALRTAADLARAIGADYDLAMILFNLAEAELIADELPRARAHAQEANDLVGDRLGHAGDAFGAAVLAGVAACLGERDVAQDHLRAAARMAISAREPEEMAIVFEYAAIVAITAGRAGDAGAMLGAALGVRRSIGQTADLDRHALRSWIAHEIRTRLGGKAFEAALIDGQAMDSGVLLHAIVEPATPRLAAAAGGFGRLSAREMEVLALVATGATDIEIGQALFISPKTASVHVSNIKGKLGLETRIDLAMAGRRVDVALPGERLARSGDRS